jgi:hypothetical protein
MTGGLVVWAAHFSALYAVSSLADVVARADDVGWRILGLGLSGVALMICVGLIVLGLKERRRSPGLANDLASTSGGIGAVAVIWQSAPLLIGY